jgi:hypothetical protein
MPDRASSHMPAGDINKMHNNRPTPLVLYTGIAAGDVNPTTKENENVVCKMQIQILRRTVNLRPTVAAGRAAANMSRAMHTLASSQTMLDGCQAYSLRVRIG